MTDLAVPRQALATAARALAHAGRWHDAAALLDAAPPEDPLLALAAAQVSVESDWFAGTSTAGHRLTIATRLAAGLDDAGRWDLAFVELRHAYRTLLMTARSTTTPSSAAAVRRLAVDLDTTAPDPVRKGWAAMYQGLIADNLLDEQDAAPAHYRAALQAGAGLGAGLGVGAGFEGGAGLEGGGDRLLAREALRHLGGHDHDAGHHEVALDRWRRATELGAAAGNVPGTLSQQLLLAVHARDAGNEAGAIALAAEVARWAAAIGAAALAGQAAAFIDGADPTAQPPAPAAPMPAATVPEAVVPEAAVPEAAVPEAAASVTQGRAAHPQPAAPTTMAPELMTPAVPEPSRPAPAGKRRVVQPVAPALPAKARRAVQPSTAPLSTAPSSSAPLSTAPSTSAPSATATAGSAAAVPALVSFMTAPLATTPRQ